MKFVCLLAITLGLRFAFAAEVIETPPLQPPNNADESSLSEEQRNIPVPVDSALPLNSLKKRDNDEFVLAPVPFLNPGQGWGLALAAQYIFTMKDDPSPPSIVGGSLFYTQNHSYGGGLGYMGKIDDDRWRIGAFAGEATIYYDFYGIGYNENKKDIAIPIRQMTGFAGFQVMYRMFEHMFGGIQLVGSAVSTTIDSSRADLQTLNDIIEQKDTNIAPSLKFQRDTRDNTFYPTKGSLANLAAAFHGPFLQDSRVYQIYKINWNQYLKMADFDVLALRGMGRFSVGDVPFYDLSAFGMRTDLRGFETGKYRDKMMWATQAEWRHRFTDRWGGVAFYGLGEVAPSVPQFQYAQILSSGGLGIRFQIANKNPVDFRFDTAYADEQFTYYFGVGQAF